MRELAPAAGANYTAIALSLRQDEAISRLESFFPKIALPLRSSRKSSLNPHKAFELVGCPGDRVIDRFAALGAILSLQTNRGLLSGATTVRRDRRSRGGGKLASWPRRNLGYRRRPAGNRSMSIGVAIPRDLFSYGGERRKPPCLALTICGRKPSDAVICCGSPSDRRVKSSSGNGRRSSRKRPRRWRAGAAAARAPNKQAAHTSGRHPN